MSKKTVYQNQQNPPYGGFFILIIQKINNNFSPKYKSRPFLSNPQNDDVSLAGLNDRFRDFKRPINYIKENL